MTKHKAGLMAARVANAAVAYWRHRWLLRTERVNADDLHWLVRRAWLAGRRAGLKEKERAKNERKTNEATAT